jgi:hypothetical protein
LKNGRILKAVNGKRVDVAYGTGAAVRGDVVDVKDGVLFLRDEEDNVAYVAIGRIAVVWEVRNIKLVPVL